MRSARSGSSPTSPTGGRFRSGSSNPRNGSAASTNPQGTPSSAWARTGRSCWPTGRRTNYSGTTKEGSPGWRRSGSFPSRFADYWKEVSLYTSRRDPGHERGNIELPALSKDGREIPVEVTLAENTVRGQRMMTAIFRDVSDRKTLEEELAPQVDHGPSHRPL